MTNNRDAVEISIKERVEGAEVPRDTECCIYKVPFNIRRHNEEAYTPKVVSIGPVHNRDLRLQDMEPHKLYYCNSFLQRTQTNWDIWIGKIEEMEPEFRRCYSHTSLNFSKKQLVNIISVDCAFILELFCRKFYTEVEDARLSTPSWNRSIKLDLLLLENQVPFFVLKRLFDLSIPSWDSPHSPQFLALTFYYFEEFNRSNLNFRDINISIRHFTDLIRTFFLQDPLPPMIHGQPMKHLPSATELSEAGLRFKVLETESCLLKLDFSGRVLEIPQLVVNDWTETLFRNMVALEECLYPHEAYITEYVNFLDFLVNTNRDVDILVQARVFVHNLPNTDSVSTMIKGLTKDITSDALSSHFFSLYVKLNAFYNNPRRKLESTVRRWKTAASSAALIILILTIVQTVCSILQVIHH